MSNDQSPRFKNRVAAFLIRSLIKSFAWTYRVTFTQGEETIADLDHESEPMIICFWHNRIFFFASVLESMLKRGFRLSVMSSLSSDGEIGAILGKKAGATIVRGSSSRQGTKGLRAMYRSIAKDRNSIAILPDGSKGPIYEAKMGVVVLSQLADCSILSMSYYADRYWEAKSWDRLIIPKPFARIYVSVGQPYRVGRDLDDAAKEHCRKKVEDTLNELGRKCRDAASCSDRKKPNHAVS